MSTSARPSTICLPAHILDAHITPRAREVLMLLASQTSPNKPELWICQAAIAQRLRCSVATVARAIQKLIETKLIAETGQLHQGRYKFYHVRWSCDENIKATSMKFPPYASSLRLSFESQEASGGRPKPVLKVVQPKPHEPALMPFERVQLTLPPVEEVETQAAPAGHPKLTERTVAPLPVVMIPPQTLTPIAAINDSRIAYYAEVARKAHAENYRMHQSILAHLR